MMPRKGIPLRKRGGSLFLRSYLLINSSLCSISGANEQLAKLSESLIVMTTSAANSGAQIKDFEFLNPIEVVVVASANADAVLLTAAQRLGCFTVCIGTPDDEVSADFITPDVLEALDMLMNPTQLNERLRNGRGNKGSFWQTTMYWWDSVRSSRWKCKQAATSLIANLNKEIVA
ncbi:MAG: hypothetical protein Q7S01_01080 [bacterium]|nr:hypothetical protein [bacterium]